MPKPAPQMPKTATVAMAGLSVQTNSRSKTLAVVSHTMRSRKYSGTLPMLEASVGSASVRRVIRLGHQASADGARELLWGALDRPADRPGVGRRRCRFAFPGLCPVQGEIGRASWRESVEVAEVARTLQTDG